MNFPPPWSSARGTYFTPCIIFFSSGAAMKATNAQPRPIHISSQNSRGVVAVSGHKREVSREDVARATEAAKAVQVPSNREILHVIPRGYIVDGQEGIKDPLGMSAVRLEVETHIVAGAATSVQNLSKCVTNANVQIDELVVSSLAAAEATLTDTEKELGVLIADIGGGTTDLAIFTDGAAYHTAVLRGADVDQPRNLAKSVTVE